MVGPNMIVDVAGMGARLGLSPKCIVRKRQRAGDTAPRGQVDQSGAVSGVVAQN